MNDVSVYHISFFLVQSSFYLCKIKSVMWKVFLYRRYGSSASLQVWTVYQCLPKVTLTYPLLAHHVQLHHSQEAPTIHLQTRLPVPMRGGWRGSMHQPISSPPPPHTDSPLSPPGSAWDCTQLTSLLPKCVWLVSLVFGSCHSQKFLEDPSRWTKILHNL